jgi:hypothetical protein
LSGLPAFWETMCTDLHSFEVLVDDSARTLFVMVVSELTDDTGYVMCITVQ